MKMKQHLIDLFKYNDEANKRTLAKLADISDREECIRLFSHLINSMNKWLGRIRQSPGYTELDWWEPKYELDQLEACVLAARALDLSRLRMLVEKWPASGWERDEVTLLYRYALLRALSVGHFLRRTTTSNV